MWHQEIDLMIGAQSVMVRMNVPEITDNRFQSMRHEPLAQRLLGFGLRLHAEIARQLMTKTEVFNPS